MKYLVAFLSGLLMACAADPYGFWLLAWIALVPLWLLAVNPKQSWQQVTFQGLLWGIGYHGFTLSWIVGLHPLTWMGIPWLTSLVIVLSCWGFITLWGTLPVIAWALGMRLFKPMLTYSNPSLTAGLRVLVGTTLWSVLEWLRSLSPLDWTSLALTQSPHNLAILHLGQLSGPLTIAAAIAAVNGSLAEVWLQHQAGSKLARIGSKLGLVLGLFAGLHGLGLVLYHHPLMSESQKPLKIGIVQGNIPTRIKLSNQGVQQAIANYTTGYEALAEQGVDAVLTSEAALPIVWNPTDPIEQQVIQTVQRQGVLMWLGTFFQQSGRTTQSLLTLDAQGDVFSRFDKVKLVPLGEYIPFEGILGGLISRLSPLSGSLSPGHLDQHFDTPFGRAAVGICYDSTFAELFRSQVKAGAQFILTASNLDPYSSAMMAQLHAQEVMRAIESDRWLVRATNTGFSGVIDPHGRTQWLSERDIYTIHTATIQRRQTQTLYVQWGNWLTLLLLSLSGFAMAARKVR
jgi:apolipoprotein N-acyltransferase